MGTVADKLNKVLSTKADIKSAIIEKGVEVLDSDTFASYGDKIRSIKGDSGGDIVEGYPLPLDELPNLEQIMANNQSKYTKYRIMYLMRDDRDTTRFPDIFYDIYTSDGKNYKYTNSSSNEPHTWNKSRDIVLSDGSRWRWLLLCVSNNTVDPTGFNDGSGFGNVEYVIYNENFQNVTQATYAKRIKFMSDTVVTLKEAAKTGALKCCHEIEGKYNATVRETLINKFGEISVPVTIFNMFNGCRRIVTTPELSLQNTSLNASSMFANCTNLKNITIDISAVTNGSSMFNFCDKLKDLSGIDIGSMTNAATMFSSCTSLEEVPELNFSACTDVSNMFAYCYNLKRIEKIGGSLTTNYTGVFRGCNQLEYIGSIDFTSAKNLNYMFIGCYNLRTINNIIGKIKESIDLSHCKSMTKDTFIKIFNALDSTSSKTITLGGDRKYTFTRAELALIPSSWTVA